MCYYRTKLKVLNVMEIYRSEQHSRLDTSDSWDLLVFDYCGRTGMYIFTNDKNKFTSSQQINEKKKTAIEKFDIS